MSCLSRWRQSRHTSIQIPWRHRLWLQLCGQLPSMTATCGGHRLLTVSKFTVETNISLDSKLTLNCRINLHMFWPYAATLLWWHDFWLFLSRCYVSYGRVIYHTISQVRDTYHLWYGMLACDLFCVPLHATMTCVWEINCSVFPKHTSLVYTFHDTSRIKGNYSSLWLQVTERSTTRRPYGKLP